MIVTICYLLKSTISVFISVQCHTSLSKNYGTHSITVVCMIGWIWEQKTFVGTLWLSGNMKSVVEQGFSTSSHLTTKCLKHSSNFEFVENVRSSSIVEFKLCHISSPFRWCAFVMHVVASCLKKSKFTCSQENVGKLTKRRGCVGKDHVRINCLLLTSRLELSIPLPGVAGFYSTTTWVNIKRLKTTKIQNCWDRTATR